MLAQHAGIGEAGTDERGVNASAHEVLTGCPHHAQLGMLADDVTEGTRHGLFRQRRADIEHAGSGGHQRQQAAIQGVDAHYIDCQDPGQIGVLGGVAAIFEHE